MKIDKAPDITWIQPYYHLLLQMIPNDTKTLLDVGAGYGIFGYIIKKTRNLSRLDAVEPFYTDLPHYDNVYKTIWKDAKFDISYDVLVATEVIEHMEKTDALKFLEDCKKVANHVIIATPKKFESQNAYDKNEYQTHKCVISKKEFKKAGYTTNKMFNNIIGEWKR